MKLGQIVIKTREEGTHCKDERLHVPLVVGGIVQDGCCGSHAKEMTEI